MYRRNIQRGVAALAFVLVMTVAGAEPAAAAQRPGWLDRLAWSTVNIPGGQALTSLLDRLSGRARLAAGKVQEKRGNGIDPNGAVVAIQVEDDSSDSTTDSNGGR
jgi:hypothetical protein